MGWGSSAVTAGCSVSATGLGVGSIAAGVGVSVGSGVAVGMDVSLGCAVSIGSLGIGGWTGTGTGLVAGGGSAGAIVEAAGCTQAVINSAQPVNRENRDSEKKEMAEDFMAI